MTSTTDRGSCEEERKLPPEIAAGLNDVSKRGELEPTGTRPTMPCRPKLGVNTWPAANATKKSALNWPHGEVTSINDLITYNLDIEKFALRT